MQILGAANNPSGAFDPAMPCQLIGLFFDADTELSMGKEREIYKINKATTVYIPKGVFHCPINFKRIGKPVLFHPIPLTPAYYTQGDASKIRLSK